MLSLKLVTVVSLLAPLLLISDRVSAQVNSGCDYLPTIRTPINGYISNIPQQNGPNSYPAGAQYTFACEPGFVQTGAGTVTCNNGVWTALPMSCTMQGNRPPAQGCALPVLPPNTQLAPGQQQQAQYSQGTTLTAICLPGYTSPVTSAQTTCLPDGTWSFPLLLCVASSPSQGPSPAPVPAPVPAPSPSNCPTCGVVQCTMPATPTGAIITSVVPADQKFDVDECIIYECSPEYEQVGDCNQIQCQAGGTWTVADFSCRLKQQLVDQCALPVTPTGATIISQVPITQLYEVDECIIYQCLDGYDQVGDCEKIQCQSGGTWTVADFSCVPKVLEVFCQLPLIPCNSYVVSGQREGGTRYQQGDVLTFACSDGFAQTAGGTTIQCQANGNWTLSGMICEGVTAKCQRPELPDFSTVVSGNGGLSEYSQGDQIRYGCQGGYTIWGTIQCDVDGYWTAANMLCVSRSFGIIPSSGGNRLAATPTGTCPIPRTPINAIPYGSSLSFTAGEYIVYQCNAGYSSNGVITCLPDGTWSGASYRCQPDVGVRSIKEDFAPLSLFKLQPNDGMSQWNAKANVMETEFDVKMCDQPTMPRNSKVILNKNIPVPPYSPGSYFEFQCDGGFTLIGATRITCQSTGQWTQLPRCM